MLPPSSARICVLSTTFEALQGNIPLDICHELPPSCVLYRYALSDSSPFPKKTISSLITGSSAKLILLGNTCDLPSKQRRNHQGACWGSSRDGEMRVCLLH